MRNQCLACPLCSGGATFISLSVPRSRLGAAGQGGWERRPRRGCCPCRATLTVMAPSPALVPFYHCSLSSSSVQALSLLLPGPAWYLNARKTERLCSQLLCLTEEETEARECSTHTQALQRPLLCAWDTEMPGRRTHSRGSRSLQNWTQGTASLRTNPGG